MVLAIEGTNQWYSTGIGDDSISVVNKWPGIGVEYK